MCVAVGGVTPLEASCSRLRRRLSVIPCLHSCGTTSSSNVEKCNKCQCLTSGSKQPGDSIFCGCIQGTSIRGEEQFRALEVSVCVAFSKRQSHQVYKLSKLEELDMDKTLTEPPQENHGCFLPVNFPD